MISKRAEAYAECLFEVSPERSLLEEFKTISSLINQKPVFAFFNSPLIDKKEKLALIESSMKNLSPSFKNFLKILITKRILFLFPEIEKAFEALLNQKENRLKGEVLSPKPLGTEEEKELKKSLKGFFKKEIELEQKQAPRLLGGLRVQIGPYVFDDSLSFHLNNFKKAGE